MNRHLYLAIAAAFLAGCTNTPPAAKKADVPAPAEKPVYFKVDASMAGTVTGKILFTGKRPPRKKIDMDEDPLCAKLHKGAVYDDPVEVGKKGAVANAFVYIKKGLEGKKFEPPAEPVVIDQHGCWFEPGSWRRVCRNLAG